MPKGATRYVRVYTYEYKYSTSCQRVEMKKSYFTRFFSRNTATSIIESDLEKIESIIIYNLGPR